MRKPTLLVLILVAACSPPQGASTSTPTTRITTTSTTTSTLPASSTTEAPATTATPPTSPSYTDLGDVDFPQTPGNIDDLPQELTRLIGGPAPDPDLHLETPEDVERWLTEWLHWAAWVQANPEDGVEALDLGLLVGTEIVLQWQTALEGRATQGERFLGYPFIPTGIVLTTFDEDFAEGKIFTLVVQATSPYPGYTIGSDGQVVEVLAAQDFSTPLELTLRPNGGGEWVVSALAPVSN